jgi:predicted phage terminase large subunit-like protein
VATNDVFVKDGMSAFICVPKLDYETDESTYPQEFPTESARKARENNYLVLMAMEQQQPLAPQDCPFFMDNLKEYTDLPDVGGKDRDIYHLAYLDTKRKGNDFCAMAIGFKHNDMFVLNDCLYDQRPMQDLYTAIVAKIIKHNISHLVVEENINEGLIELLKRMLEERGYFGCKITGVYNYEKKDDRIAGEEANIKAFIKFPKFGMYPRSSDFGKAMEELYSYSYKRKNDHDDFTDACAGFSRAFINTSRTQNVKISTFLR